MVGAPCREGCIGNAAVFSPGDVDAQGLRSEWLCLGHEPTPGRHKDPTPTPAKLNSGTSREERGGTLHQSLWLFLWGPSVILIVALSANPHRGPQVWVPFQAAFPSGERAPQCAELRITQVRCERLPRISERDSAVFWSRKRTHRESHSSDIWACFPLQTACLLWAPQSTFLKIQHQEDRLLGTLVGSSEDQQ